MCRTELRRSTIVLCALMTSAALGVNAQRHPHRSKLPRGLVGISATLARPIGEFQDFVDWGVGLSLGSVVNLRPTSWVGIRFEGSVIDYGLESDFTSVNLGDRIRRNVTLNTNNLILSLGVGPQLTLGRGRLRPYGYGTLGFSYFATVTSAVPVPGGEPLLSDTNFDHLNPALSGGVGMLLRVGRGTHAVSLDLAVHTQINGETTYLRPGGILPGPPGSLSFDPVESVANLVAIRLGVAFGV